MSLNLTPSYSSHPEIPSRRKDSDIFRKGYTEPYLTPLQTARIVGYSSIITAILNRPISQFFRFKFMSDVPGQDVHNPGIMEKRTKFFNTLLSTKWWANGSASVLASFATYSVVLGSYAFFYELTGAERGWPYNGFYAGALTGMTLTAVRHPIDVLRATAQAPGPKKFTGPFDVLMTSIRHKPEVLKGLYRGAAVAGVATTLQCSAMFGLFNTLKYDAVRNGDVYLYALCHSAAYLGHLCQYPFHNLKQSWLAQRQAMKMVASKEYTLRMHLNVLRKKHGISMVFDGFYRVSPFWTSAPLAIALFSFDKMNRYFTEKTHPERIVVDSGFKSILIPGLNS